MRRKCLMRSSALFLLTALLLTQTAPAWGSSENGETVIIWTGEEFADFSRRCSLDTWSQGKTVVLKADIDLKGISFSPIPSFGGSFDGQGHRVTGFTLTGAGSNQGLFRYIQQDGQVRNLIVEGRIEPAGSAGNVGGIAGSNSGIISNCIFNGEVAGKDTVGGLAGLNTAAGKLVNCTASANVTGEHYVGGVVGRNLGSLVQCENSGGVNITEVKATVAVEELDLTQLNATENIPSSTDIGGIAGFSTGIIQGCRNTGSVGYEHVGYNVGGIVGRQSGYLDGCSNSGTVRGRKDVGGIAGQLEPELLLTYSESALNRLWDELDALQKLMDQSLDEAGDSSHAVSAQLSVLSGRTSEVKDSAAALSDAFVQWADGGIDAVNDVSARISWTLDQMDPALYSAQESVEQMEEAARQLRKALDEGSLAADLGRDAAADLRLAVEEAERALSRTSAAFAEIRKGLDALRKNLGDNETLSEALYELSAGLADLSKSCQEVESAFQALLQAMRAGDTEIWSNPAWAELRQGITALGESMKEIARAIDTLSAALKDWDIGAITDLFSLIASAFDGLAEAGADMSEAADDVCAALDDLTGAGDSLRDAADILGQAAGSLSGGAGSLADAIEEMRRIVRALADKPSIQLTPLDDGITEKGDVLNEALSGLMDEADRLNSVMDSASESLLDNLRAISAQMGNVTDALRQAVEAGQESSSEDYFEDVSDQNGRQNSDAGTISSSQNTGIVEGDVNVAGIVGSMAVEYDFDPEDDLTERGSRSADFRFQAKAVVRSCINAGKVTARKDYVGGIAGRMDLGSLSDSESYGPVTSTGGDYVGGVAGASRAAIRDCWVKCTLSGRDYVGGVAGLGETLTGCRVLAELEEGREFLGTVAGDVSGSGTVEENYFTHQTLAGIDGVSYAGNAEPVTFDYLTGGEGVPDAFTSFSLTFIADGETVAVIPFSYGDSLSALPEIPAKDGYTARWPELNLSCLTFSRTLEAEYIPYASALSAGGEPPQILVDGSFSSEAEMKVSHTEVQWSDGIGNRHSGVAYTVTVADPELGSPAYTVHYRLPGDGSYTLWVLCSNGSWQQQSYETDGSYLLLKHGGDSVTFCVTAQGGERGIILLIAVCTLMLILILVFLERSRRKRKREKAVQTETDPLAQNMSDVVG